MNEICMKHDVKVISDEIHCELIMPGNKFIPFASVNEDCQNNSITLSSPSKSFNTAGLQIANINCSNKEWRRRINRIINVYEVCDVNPFGPIALEAAYNEGEEWLDQLNQYIWENYDFMKAYFLENLKPVEVLKLEGTYLAWIDISAFELTSNEAFRELMKDGKVYVNSGTMYGKKAGEGYLRINLACPRETLKVGLRRICQILGQYDEDSLEIGCPL